MKKPEYSNVPFDPELIGVLRGEQATHGTVTNYLTFIERSYRRLPLRKELEVIAAYVEPVDRTLGVDPNIAIGQAFYRGSLLGLHAARLTLGRNFDRRLPTAGIEIESDVDPDPLVDRQISADSIIDIAGRGLSKIPEAYDALFDEWDSAITPDIRHQPFIRRGFGLVAEHVHVVLAREVEETHAADRLAFEAEAARVLESPQEIDWSALLQ